jgi:DNA ligase (NAD+)
MDTVNVTTPNWLTGLVVLFALAAAAVFGLLLWRQSEYAGITERQLLLQHQSDALEPIVSSLPRVRDNLNTQITTREEHIRKVQDADTTNRNDVDRLVTQNEQTLKANTDLQAKELATYLEEMKEMPTARHELEKEEEHQFAAERDSDDRRRQLREDVEKMSQTIEGRKKEGRHQNSDLDGRIAELESRVRQLTQQQDLANRDFRSAGQIIASQAADGFVVINRGHHQNLRSGTKFVVFNKRGGRTIQKGIIQVLQVDQEIATARVLSEYDANDPLIVGDHLHNPIYDPDKVLHFAIRGDFNSFSVDELKRFISDAGDVIDPDLTIRTDYLVAGGNAQSALEQATRLGVSILSEDQLLEFVRPKPKFSSVEGFDLLRQMAAAGKTFTFAGDFSQVSRSTVSSWITAHGGRTTGSLAAGTDAVVVGDHAEDAMAKARALGIAIIDQSQFAHLGDSK